MSNEIEYAAVTGTEECSEIFGAAEPVGRASSNDAYATKIARPSITIVDREVFHEF